MNGLSLKASLKGVELLSHLLSFLGESFNDIQANYFQSIVSNIFEHNPVAFTTHLASLPEAMANLVARSDSHSIS